MKLPVLCYHNILKKPKNAKIRNHFIEPKIFEKQIKYLSDNRYKTIHSSQISKILSLKTINFKPIIITFDDGYEDNYHYAFPILKKYGFSAIFFITVGRIGKKANWHKKKNDYCGQIMTYSHIKELSLNNMEIHPHSYSHCFLNEIPQNKLIFELNESQKILTKITDQKCNVLSYPAGKFNNNVIKILKENNYISAVTTNYGINNEKDNIFSLKRIEIKQRDIALIRFKKRLLV